MEESKIFKLKRSAEYELAIAAILKIFSSEYIYVGLIKPKILNSYLPSLNEKLIPFPKL